MNSTQSILEFPGRLAVEVRKGRIRRIGLREEVHNFADLTSDPVARQAMRQLVEYFRGDRKTFELPLDWEKMRVFQRKILGQLCEIPYGETRSYRWLAERAGCPKASRAVGRALATNPFPFIIPCHRVIRSDGGLGGYYFGLSCKQQLLELESRHI